MSEQSQEIISQAVESYQAGRLDDAIQLARQAIDLDERDASAYSMLGVCLSQAGRFDEATEALQRAIRSAPYVATHYYNLALHYNRMGEKHDAISMCQEAIRTDGKHRRAHELLRRLETETKVEIAPYTTSLGDQRGSAYRYGAETDQAGGPEKEEA